MRPLNKPEQPYSNQEIFNRVWQHFIVEKNPRCVENGECRYDRTGCAIGCLLTQEDGDKLQSSCEGFAVWTQEVKMNIQDYCDLVGPDLLSDLQFWHDRSNRILDKNELIRIAKRYDLEIPNESN